MSDVAAVTKAMTRNPLKFAGVPQTGKPISAVSGPKFTILWEHLEEILLFNNFFSDCRYGLTEIAGVDIDGGSNKKASIRWQDSARR